MIQKKYIKKLHHSASHCWCTMYSSPSMGCHSGRGDIDLREMAQAVLEWVAIEHGGRRHILVMED